MGYLQRVLRGVLDIRDSAGAALFSALRRSLSPHPTPSGHPLPLVSRRLGPPTRDGRGWSYQAPPAGSSIPLQLSPPSPLPPRGPEPSPSPACSKGPSG